MRGLEEQTRGGRPFSGEEMLFLKLKFGEGAGEGRDV